MVVLYTRQSGGYKYKVTEDETTGQEIYKRHDDAASGIAPGALPVVGTTALDDPDGNAVASCVCRSKEFIYESGDTAMGAHWTFLYSTTKGAGGNPGKNVNTDPETRRFEMGGKILSIKSGEESWYWETDQTPVKQPIAKLLTVGSFTIPKGPLTPAQKTTFIGLVKTQASTLNDAAFEDFAEGQVMFEGIRGGTTFVDGELNFQFEMMFTYKIINDDWQVVSKDDWFYLWREDNGTWDIPNDSPSGAGNRHYKKTDFTLLV